MFEINAAIGAATTAIHVLKAAVDARDDAKIKAAVADISIRLLDVATNANSLAAENGTLQSNLHSAQAELRELREKVAERDRYTLSKLGVLGEFYAYKLRASTELSDRKDEVPHYVCQPCFDSGKKSVLHVSQYIATCPVCRVVGHLESRSVTSRTYGSSNGDDW